MMYIFFGNEIGEHLTSIVCWFTRNVAMIVIDHTENGKHTRQMAVELRVFLD